MSGPSGTSSPEAQTYVYDRLLFDTEFTLESYQQALKDQGFEVLEALEPVPAPEAKLPLPFRAHSGRIILQDAAEHYEWLAKAYMETAAAVDKNEIEWAPVRLPEIIILWNSILSG